MAALANGATATGNVTLPKSCVVLGIEQNRAGWVRLYSSVSASAGDASRTRGGIPTPGAGVAVDVILLAAAIQTLEPKPLLVNAETPTTTSYPVRATNDGTTGNFIVTVHYLQLEA
jgi:hypothetical protein